MENEIINIRDVIINKMKEKNLSFSDLCERTKNHYQLLKFMDETSFLTFDLAEQLGVILDLNPLFIIKNELKYMQIKDRKDYKGVFEFYKKSTKKLVKRPQEREILLQKEKYIENNLLKKLYENYKDNKEISTLGTYQEFEKYFKKITNIEDINHMTLQDFQLSYKELDNYSALNIIFWTKQGEYEVSKIVNNLFNKDTILKNLDEIMTLKEELNDNKLKESLLKISENWGILLLFKTGQQDLKLDGFCKWYDSNTPLIIVRDNHNAQSNYKEFIQLLSHIITGINNMSRIDKSVSQFYFYDTPLICAGEKYDNYIRDFQIIIADRFINKYFNIGNKKDE